MVKHFSSEEDNTHHHHHLVAEKAEELLDTTIRLLTTLQREKRSTRHSLVTVETSIQYPKGSSIHTSRNSKYSLVPPREDNPSYPTSGDKLDDKYGTLAAALLSLVTRVSGLIICCVYMSMPKSVLDEKLKKSHKKVVDLIVHLCTGECSIVIVVSILLLLGLVLHKKSLFLPWLVISFFESFCCLIAIIPLIAFSITEKLWYPVFIWICFMVPLISLHRYSASFVASHYWTLLQRDSDTESESEPV